MSEDDSRNGLEEDPASEFLAREQENLAGIEDDFTHLTTDSPTTNGTNGNGLDDYNGEIESNKPESENIRLWREQQEIMLTQKDQEESVKKDELRDSAKKELEEWYTRYQDQLEKSKAINREACKNAEKEFIAERDQQVTGQDWDKIAKMCDFNPKSVRNTKDTSRLKSILLQLKQAPPSDTVNP